jgi:Domain of Unknown Function (DUF928)
MKLLQLTNSLALTLISISIDWQPIQAQVNPNRLSQTNITPLSTNIKKSKKPIRFTPPPVPNRGIPLGRARGGASRSKECQIAKEPLTALVPNTGKNSIEVANISTTISKNNFVELEKFTSESVWALTASDRPSFWFYIPYSLNSNHSIEFVLQDETDNTLYQNSFTFAETKPGVMQVKLPNHSTPLEIGKRYHWYFLVYCHADDPVYVEGWVERVAVSPNLQVKLARSTPEEKADLYAANGIWYDALTNLAQLRQMYPNDVALRSDWESLLDSVGLGAIASQPILRY